MNVPEVSRSSHYSFGSGLLNRRMCGSGKDKKFISKLSTKEVSFKQLNSTGPLRKIHFKALIRNWWFAGPFSLGHSLLLINK